MSWGDQQRRQQKTSGQGDTGAAPLQGSCADACAKAGPLQQEDNSLVQVDVLMHADNGEIIVTDVNLVPDLSEGSVMLQQASDVLWDAEQGSCRGLLSVATVEYLQH